LKENFTCRDIFDLDGTGTVFTASDLSIFNDLMSSSLRYEPGGCPGDIIVGAYPLVIEAGTSFDMDVFAESLRSVQNFFHTPVRRAGISIEFEVNQSLADVCGLSVVDSTSLCSEHVYSQTSSVENNDGDTTVTINANNPGVLDIVMSIQGEPSIKKCSDISKTISISICQDSDGDGFNKSVVGCGPADCDDNNNSIYPGAPDIACDNIDQDCSGSAFNGTDSDGDSYKVEGGLCGSVDCNDTDSSINPGANDICGNSVDEDCSGSNKKCSSGSNSNSCTSDWSCEDWSDCVSGKQERTCTDLDDCDSDYTEEQECTCEESWTCAAWLPRKCPSSEKQKRKCYDSNKCSDDDEVKETRECESGKVNDKEKEDKEEIIPDDKGQDESDKGSSEGNNKISTPVGAATGLFGFANNLGFGWKLTALTIFGSFLGLFAYSVYPRK